MAEKRDRQRQVETGHSCGECGAKRPRGWSGEFVHCADSGTAWQTRRDRESPHHGHVLYAPCWRCHQPLGCDECSGVVTEVLCKRCAVWGTPEALAVHGPMLNTPAMVERRRGLVAPPVGAYPAAFRAAYDAVATPIPPTTTVREMVANVIDRVGIERGLPAEDE